MGLNQPVTSIKTWRYTELWERVKRPEANIAGRLTEENKEIAAGRNFLIFIDSKEEGKGKKLCAYLSSL